MYVYSRLLRATNAAHLPQVIENTGAILAHLNAEHGTAFSAGMQVGGDPRALGVTGPFETMADIQRTLEATLGDEQYQSLVDANTALIDPDMQDTIWSVRIPPGEQKDFSVVTSVNVVLTRVADAMTFAAEAASTVSDITGNPSGVATAVNGDRSRLVWVGYGESLAEMQQNTDKLEADSAYLDLFKKSDGLVVANSMEQTIWRRVA